MLRPQIQLSRRSRDMAAEIGEKDIFRDLNLF